jgi:hypothetical protein
VQRCSHVRKNVERCAQLNTRPPHFPGLTTGATCLLLPIASHTPVLPSASSRGRTYRRS